MIKGKEHHTYTDSHSRAKEPWFDDIPKQIAAYLKKGGKIYKATAGESIYQKRYGEGHKHPFVINPKLDKPRVVPAYSKNDARVSGVPRAHTSLDYYKAGRQKVLVACKLCGHEDRCSQAKMRKFHASGYVCKACNDQGRKELRESRLAMAKSKTEKAKK